MTKTIVYTWLEYLWVVDFTTLCIFAALALRQRQNNSSLMTQAIVVIISGIINKYQALVNTFASPETSLTTLILWCAGFLLYDGLIAFVLYRHYQNAIASRKPTQRIAFVVTAVCFVSYIICLQYLPLLFAVEGPSYKLWIMTAFYLGAAALAILIIVVIRQAHELSKKSYQWLAKMYSLAFFIVASIYVARFTEKLLWQSDYTGWLYLWGLISINIGTSAAGLFIACLAGCQFGKVCKKLHADSRLARQDGFQAPSASSEKTDSTGGITWDQLGDKPMYGDMSDQGAVDIAIKIKDLEAFESEAETRSRRLYYSQKIKAECNRLVEITLLQVAPPPETPEPTLIADTADKLIDFEQYKARKAHDPEATGVKS